MILKCSVYPSLGVTARLGAVYNQPSRANVMCEFSLPTMFILCTRIGIVVFAVCDHSTAVLVPSTCASTCTNNVYTAAHRARGMVSVNMYTDTYSCESALSLY